MTDGPEAPTSALREAMLALSASLVESFRASGVVDHALTKGEMRESELLSALRPHVPRRYDLTSGIVVNSSNAQSKQQDLLITDLYSVAPFIQTGGIQVVPIEAVVAAIQVKSRLTSAAVGDGVTNIASVMELMDYRPRLTWKETDGDMQLLSVASKPFGAVLAFALDTRLMKIFEAFVAANMKLEPRNRCRALCVLGEGVIVWGADEDGMVIQHSPEGARSALLFESGDASLLLFYVTLMEAVGTYVPPPFRTFSYMQAAGLDWHRTIHVLDESVRGAEAGKSDEAT